tara:strand:+ start:60 stop:659 length:600 start_codon:yes stop_codon:yes gene_type:complete
MTTTPPTYQTFRDIEKAHTSARSGFNNTADVASLVGQVQMNNLAVVIKYPTNQEVVIFIGDGMNKVSFDSGMMWVEPNANTFVYDPTASTRASRSMTQINEYGAGGTSEPYFLSMDANAIAYFYYASSTTVGPWVATAPSKAIGLPVGITGGATTTVTPSPSPTPQQPQPIAVKTPSAIGVAIIRPFANWDGNLPTQLS